MFSYLVGAKRFQILHYENHFVNSETWRENTPELSDSSGNGLFHFDESTSPEVGVMARRLAKVKEVLAPATKGGGMNINCQADRRRGTPSCQSLFRLCLDPPQVI